jgi:hypothetical protein
MDYFIKTTKDEKTNKSQTKITFLGYVVILLILVIVIVSVGTATNWGKKISSFTSPEKEMDKKVIKIKSLDTNIEPFNNDLPNPQVDLTAGVDANCVSESGKDYSDIIAGQALEKSVFDQHKAYINEKNKVTNTASRNPTRSDSQDVIPFVGLRRPQYQIAGKDMVDSTARQVPSVLDADQLSKPNNLRWN